MNAAIDTVVNIDESNAARLLIDESHQRPVVVDFWADWCEPCKVLMPLLEKIAAEYQGAFLLAKVNADQQPMITQQFGVRSLPTVMVMVNGQPVDGFAGAQSEAQVRQMLEKYLPRPWDGLLQMAQEAMVAGDFGAALTPLRQAWEDSSHEHEITLLYAQALIESLRLDEAEQVLDKVRMVDQDATWEQLKAMVSLKREAAKSPEVEALEARLEQSPDDAELRVQLAVAYTGAGYNREALEHLFLILRSDLNHANGVTRKSFLDIVASLGKGDPLAAEYQRKLYSLLY
ncbi:MAG: thioredoxin [Parahaliea sp.]